MLTGDVCWHLIRVMLLVLLTVAGPQSAFCVVLQFVPGVAYLGTECPKVLVSRLYKYHWSLIRPFTYSNITLVTVTHFQFVSV